MKFTIVGKKTEVPRGLYEIIEKKLAKFDKFFKDGAEANVSIKSAHNLETLELTIVSGGVIYRSEKSDKTYQNALDDVIYSIERQIRKNKTRLEKKLREGVFVKGSDAYVPSENEDVDETIGDFEVRMKYFNLKPMSIEEAILQMLLLDHQFFVFKNDVTEEVNVVYIRKDGGYGCIAPEN
ncbi:MAG: ribosome-associated translation inhibitor RaiA [Ruminococcaceae bacterium]|nr:ribosome-associated translation inhibitor RaiA [Oscillospiraceae bacterium]